MSEDSIEDKKSIGDGLQCYSVESKVKSAEKTEILNSKNQLAPVILDIESTSSECLNNETHSTNVESNIENTYANDINCAKLNETADNTEDSLDSFELIDYPDPDEIQIAGFNKKKLLEMSHFCKITYGNNDLKLSQSGYKTKAEFIDEGYYIIPFYYSNKTLAGFVFTKDREITIAYRGTQGFDDIMTDINSWLTIPKFLPEGGRAHCGFYYSFYDSLDSLYCILETHASEKKLAIKDFKFYLTGHSMGGAIAKIAALFLNKKLDVQDLHVATFADPRVFDLTASESYNKALPNRTIRVVQHRCDPVPAVAPGILGYVHVGEQLRISVISKYTIHKIDGYYQAINAIKESDFQSDNSSSIFYYPVRALILTNDAILGNIQYYTANFIRYFAYQNTSHIGFNIAEDLKVVPYQHNQIPTVVPNCSGYTHINVQLKIPIISEVHKLGGHYQAICVVKGSNFQLSNNVSIPHSSVRVPTPINSVILAGLFNRTGFNVDGHFGGKVEFVIQGSSFNHKNKKIKAIQNLDLVEVNDQQKNGNLFDDVSFDKKGSVQQLKIQLQQAENAALLDIHHTETQLLQANHTQNLEESMESNVIQNGDLNNKSLEFEAEDSKLAFDEEQQAIITRFDEALLQLVKFQELYRKYSKSATKTPTKKRLIDNYREFITKHPDINLGRSDVANLKTICAHGTNAWTVFSASAFTNLQLLPKFAMKVRGIPIGAGELISEKEKAKFNKWVSYPNTISQNYISTVRLGSKDSALAEVFDYADKSVELYKRGYDKFKEKLLKKCKDQSVVQELKEILKSDLMSKTYEALSSIPVVIIGDGIGGVGVDSSISGETGYERVNIRIIALPKVLQIFIQKLIEKINPKKFKDVAFLAMEELADFEGNRPKKEEPICYKEVGGPGGRLIPIGVHENTFIHDFLNTFGNKLPFSISDKFDRVPIERTTLEKKAIKGELIASTSKVGYYKANPDINVTYDEEDSSYLNAEVANNLYPINKQECDEIEDIQQLKVQPPIIENFYSIEDLNFKLTSYIESSMSNVSSSTTDDDYQTQVVVDKIVSNKQQQKANLTKKAVYTTTIISPFIAVGIYSAVALSMAGVVFNPVVAAGIFIGVAVATIACFAIIKVSGEKDKDKNISTCTALKNVFTPECFKSSEAAIS